MAKLKKTVVIKVFSSVIPILQIWANDLSAKDIMSIEGITSVLSLTTLPWIAHVDIRYDIYEVAKELEELLEASVPDIFRE